MVEPHLFAALVLLATVSAGLLRALIGTDRVERLLALQLLGTTAVAVVLLLGHEFGLPALRNVALVVGLLAAIVAVAFVRYGGLDRGPNEPER